MRSPTLSVLLALWGSCAALTASNCSGDPSSGSGAAGTGGPGGTGSAAGCQALGDCDEEDAGDAAEVPSDAKDDGSPDVTDAGDASDDADDASDTSDAQACGDPEPTCPGALACCSSTCVDVHQDPAHCGGCGVTCDVTKLCTGTACAPLVLASVCLNPRATVSLDAYPIDVEAGSVVGDALKTACSPPVAVDHLDQASPALLDQATGQPIGGPGHTLVAGGGPFGQKGLAYLDQLGKTPLYVVQGSASVLFIRRQGGLTLVDAPNATVDAHHDYFALYVAVDPKSGTLAIAAYGMLGPGTTAAAWYWENKVAPTLATWDKAWYLVEWTDADSDGKPGPADGFVTIASGL